MNLQKEHIEPVSFKTGQTLFRENEESYHFYIIQEGQVEVFKTGENGTKLPLAVVSDGTAIGEFAMIDRKPRSATAVALTEVKAMKVSEKAYQQLIGELPEWAVSVMRALVERLRQTNEIIRRSEIVDENILRQIESIEYDPDASTVRRGPETDPYDDDDSPDLN